MKEKIRAAIDQHVDGLTTAEECITAIHNIVESDGDMVADEPVAEPVPEHA